MGRISLCIILSFSMISNGREGGFQIDNIIQGPCWSRHFLCLIYGYVEVEAQVVNCKLDTLLQFCLPIFAEIESA